jgi:hypothetical protein
MMTGGSCTGGLTGAMAGMVDNAEVSGLHDLPPTPAAGICFFRPVSFPAETGYMLETEFLDSFMAVRILELNVVQLKDLKRSIK